MGTPMRRASQAFRYFSMKRLSPNGGQNGDDKTSTMDLRTKENHWSLWLFWVKSKLGSLYSVFTPFFSVLNYISLS